MTEWGAPELEAGLPPGGEELGGMDGSGFTLGHWRVETSLLSPIANPISGNPEGSGVAQLWAGPGRHLFPPVPLITAPETL